MYCCIYPIGFVETFNHPFGDAGFRTHPQCFSISEYLSTLICGEIIGIFTGPCFFSETLFEGYLGFAPKMDLSQGLNAILFTISCKCKSLYFFPVIWLNHQATIPQITIFIGGMFAIPSHGWLTALF